MRVRNAFYWALVALYVVLWVGGVALRWAPSRDPAPAWAAPAFLLAAALLAATSAREWGAAALFAGGGYLAELVGVHTGWPFGSYAYSGQLGPEAAGVPVAIAFAWLTLLLFARDLGWRLAPGPIYAALAGAAVMTALDLIVDPVATRILGYWQWRQSGLYYGVPLINFAGWFLISLLFLGIAGRPRTLSNRVLAVGASVVTFFALVAVA